MKHTRGYERRTALVRNGWLRVLTKAELAVWTVYESCANDKKGDPLSYPGSKEIADAIGHGSKSHIGDIRKALVSHGLMEIVEEGGGRGKCWKVRMLLPPKRFPADGTLSSPGKGSLQMGPFPAPQRFPSDGTLSGDKGSESEVLKVPTPANKGSHSGELHNKDGSKKEVRSIKAALSADGPRTPAVEDAQETPPRNPAGHLPGIDPTPAREAARKPRKTPTGPHPTLIRHFTAKWRERYDADYRFVGERDGKMISEILSATGGDLDRARRVVDSYFASDDPFYAKNAHPLTLLVGKINTFVGATAGSNGHCYHDDAFWEATPERVNELNGYKPGDPGYIPVDANGKEIFA